MNNILEKLKGFYNRILEEYNKLNLTKFQKFLILVLIFVLAFVLRKKSQNE
jgi:hypothetical protein